MKSDSITALRRTSLSAAMIALIGCSAMASAAVSTADLQTFADRANFTADLTTREVTRYIVTYAADSAERNSLSSMRVDLDRVARETGMKVEHVRTLATGAELVSATFAKPDASRLAAGSREARAQSVMIAFAKNSAVDYVEPDRIMQIALTPNDTNYSSQWDLFESTGGMNQVSAWDIATGSGVRVAVIDTGIAPHSDLSGQIVGGYDFISDAAAARDGNGRDSNPNDQGDWFGTNECGVPYSSNSSWHGTHVAGTIAAATNNSKGVAGIAYGADVVPIRVLGKCGGSVSDIVDAMVWASGGSVSGVPANPNPARVINMSLGGSGSCGSFQAAVNTARANGTVLAIAAGNSNANVSGFSPANCSGVISVAATDRQGNRASYSNYGSTITLSAPGGETASQTNGILSTLNNGTTTQGSEGYAYYQGTSMAAPHVAGLAALMLEVDSSLTPDGIRNAMTANARSLPGSCSGGCGAGIIDSLATLQSLDGGGPGPGDNVLENGVAETGLSGSTGNTVLYTMTVPAGASNLKFAMSGGSGDADLYVRFGSAPTTSTYDCRPYVGGNTETCNMTAQAGTYYVMVRAYSSYSGVSLTGSYSTGGGGCTPSGTTLCDGSSVSGLAASSGNWTSTYTLDVPAGASNLQFTISGGSGDADMYVRLGSAPTTGSYNCRPYLNGNNETCTFSAPTAGRYYVRIRAYSSFSGVTLGANYTP